MLVEAELGGSRGGTMRWLAGQSEWRLLVGVVPALLAVLTVELLVGPEVVELLVGQLVQGVEAQPRFARGMIMMSALTVSYVALCLALLAYYCGGVGASPLPADRKRRLAVAGIGAWIGFHAVLAGLTVVDLQLYSIAYDSIVSIYRQAGGPVAAAMTGDVGPLGVSRHLISILLPVAFGVAAVCAGSCHAAAIVEGARGENHGDPGQTTRDAADRLVHSLMAIGADGLADPSRGVRKGRHEFALRRPRPTELPDYGASDHRGPDGTRPGAWARRRRPSGHILLQLQ